MIEYSYQQGSEEWHQLRDGKRTASEASAMMGDSKHKTRSQLLRDKVTEQKEEITPSMQFIFNKGHVSEEAIRPHVEKLIGEELFPVTGVSEEHADLLASFDGLTLDGDINFEHKLLNGQLIKDMMEDNLGPHYYWQLEQQMLVSGASKTIFVCSDGTPENMYYIWYTPVPGRVEALMEGWHQFDLDMVDYIHDPVEEKAVAEPVRTLPAITYKMDGLSLTSNLGVFRAAAEDLVVQASVELSTDQDFANAEALVKEFQSAEDKIKALQKAVLGEVQDIETFTTDLAFIGDQIRQARLTTDKQVKARKEELRATLITESSKIMDHFIADLWNFPDTIHQPHVEYDFRATIKGKRTIQSVKDALETRVAALQIGIRMSHKTVTANLAWIGDRLTLHYHLFYDINEFVQQELEPFQAIVERRISEDSARRQAAAEAIRLAEVEAPDQPQAQQSTVEAISAMPVVGVKSEPATEPQGSSAIRISPELYQWAKKWDIDSAAVNELLNIIQSGTKAA